MLLAFIMMFSGLAFGDSAPNNAFPEDAFKEMVDALYGYYSDLPDGRSLKSYTDKARLFICDANRDGNWEMAYVSTCADQFALAGFCSFDADGRMIFWNDFDLLTIPKSGEGDIKIMAAEVNGKVCYIVRKTRSDSYVRGEMERTLKEYGFASADGLKAFTVLYPFGEERIIETYSKRYDYDDDNKLEVNYYRSSSAEGGEQVQITAEEFNAFEESISVIQSCKYGQDDPKSSKLTAAYAYLERFAKKYPKIDESSVPQGKKDLDAMGAEVIYPRDDEYLEKYREMTVEAGSGSCLGHYGILSSDNEKVAAIHVSSGTKVTAIAKHVFTYDTSVVYYCCIFDYNGVKTARWINGAYLK